MALVNLDDDTDLDLVILHREGLDAYQGMQAAALTTTVEQGTVTPGSIGAAGEEDVDDVNGDFDLDILSSTTELLEDADGEPRRCTRLLLGGAGLTFELENTSCRCRPPTPARRTTSCSPTCRASRASC